MELPMKEIPLETPLRKKPGINKEKIRSKVRLKIIDYDDNDFMVGIKRGIPFVKKFMVPKKVEGNELTPDVLEKELRRRVTKGEFDKEIFEDYEKVKPKVKKGKRGRPRKKQV